MRQQDIDRLHAVEISLATEQGLVGIVMLRRVDDELQAGVVPAGKSARSFADVLLAVVAHPHGEQLHDLAGKVLVRCAFDIHGCIEIFKHGRVLRDGDHQRSEIAGRLRTKQLVLLVHLAVVADFFFAGGKVAVPEQSHFFFQRTLACQHAVSPPVAEAVRL